MGDYGYVEIEVVCANTLWCSQCKRFFHNDSDKDCPRNDKYRKAVRKEKVPGEEKGDVGEKGKGTDEILEKAVAKEKGTENPPPRPVPPPTVKAKLKVKPRKVRRQKWKKKEMRESIPKEKEVVRVDSASPQSKAASINKGKGKERDEMKQQEDGEKEEVEKGEKSEQERKEDTSPGEEGDKPGKEEEPGKLLEDGGMGSRSRDLKDSQGQDLMEIVDELDPKALELPAQNQPLTQQTPTPSTDKGNTEVMKVGKDGEGEGEMLQGENPQSEPGKEVESGKLSDDGGKGSSSSGLKDSQGQDLMEIVDNLDPEALGFPAQNQPLTQQIPTPSIEKGNTEVLEVGKVVEGEAGTLQGDNPQIDEQKIDLLFKAMDEQRKRDQKGAKRKKKSVPKLQEGLLAGQRDFGSEPTKKSRLNNGLDCFRQVFGKQSEKEEEEDPALHTGKRTQRNNKANWELSFAAPMQTLDRKDKIRKTVKQVLVPLICTTTQLGLCFLTTQTPDESLELPIVSVQNQLSEDQVVSLTQSVILKGMGAVTLLQEPRMGRYLVKLQDGEKKILHFAFLSLISLEGTKEQWLQIHPHWMPGAPFFASDTDFLRSIRLGNDLDAQQVADWLNHADAQSQIPPSGPVIYEWDSESDFQDKLEQVVSDMEKVVSDTDLVPAENRIQDTGGIDHDNGLAEQD
uniref:Uncharacterized protein n=1 Tax=Chara braunii TaxID=69332 RepID=A0A388LTV2_CHABU